MFAKAIVSITSYPLVKSDDPVLKICTPVFVGDFASLSEIAEGMIGTRYWNQALGVAAPQVGFSLRMFVMLVDECTRVFINPEILYMESNSPYPVKEGCLSFPGVEIQTARPRSIIASYQDLTGKRYTIRLSGLEAVCFQHEYDHINGIVFHEREVTLFLE